MLEDFFFSTYAVPLTDTKRASQVAVAYMQSFQPQESLSMVTPQWLQLIIIPHYKIIDY